MSVDLSDADLQKAIHESIEIVAYDATWPARFQAELQRLTALAGDRISDIVHVGSTAVPGLPAKPIVDIIGVVKTLAEADALVALLCQHGYSASVEFNASLVDKRWLMKQENGRRTAHLHLVLPGHEEWANKVNFRDALRSDANRRVEYSKLKQQLATDLGHDREAYTAAKTDFVQEVLSEYLATRKGA